MSKHKILFLCKTPLQAIIILRIIELLNIKEYDVVYLTKNNTSTDQNYFKKISSNSCNYYYIFSHKVGKGFNTVIDIFEIIRLSNSLISDLYQDIYVASFDNLIFRYILKNNPSAKIKSFDDGTANITPSSSYFNYDKRKRTILLNKLLSIPDTKKVKQLIEKHYTIYNGFNNIVDEDKLVLIPLFQFNNAIKRPENAKDLTVFIGQPFHEYLNENEIKKVQNWLSSIHIDYYIKHPREDKPIVSNTSYLDTKSLIAEEAIWKLSNKNRVTIVSGYSTVLFNMNIPGINRIYLSASNHPDEKVRVALIERINCRVIKV